MLRTTGVRLAARFWLSAFLALAQAGCFWGGPNFGPPVQDQEALAFSQHALRFYRSLEAVPIDALLTYENPELQSYFVDRAAFNDYYSSLANQIRDAGFRDERADQMVIVEFRFDGSDRASVDLRIAGRHERGLRFWEMELWRFDTWQRIDGVWVLTPDRL